MILDTAQDIWDVVTDGKVVVTGKVVLTEREIRDQLINEVWNAQIWRITREIGDDIYRAD